MLHKFYDWGGWARRGETATHDANTPGPLADGSLPDDMALTGTQPSLPRETQELWELRAEVARLRDIRAADVVQIQELQNAEEELKERHKAEITDLSRLLGQVQTAQGEAWQQLQTASEECETLRVSWDAERRALRQQVQRLELQLASLREAEERYSRASFELGQCKAGASKLQEQLDKVTREKRLCEQVSLELQAEVAQKREEAAKWQLMATEVEELVVAAVDQKRAQAAELKRVLQAEGKMREQMEYLQNQVAASEAKVEFHAGNSTALRAQLQSAMAELSKACTAPRGSFERRPSAADGDSVHGQLSEAVTACVQEMQQLRSFVGVLQHENGRLQQSAASGPFEETETPFTQRQHIQGGHQQPATPDTWDEPSDLQTCESTFAESAAEADLLRTRWDELVATHEREVQQLRAQVDLLRDENRRLQHMAIVGAPEETETAFTGVPHAPECQKNQGTEPPVVNRYLQCNSASTEELGNNSAVLREGTWDEASQLKTCESISEESIGEADMVRSQLHDAIDAINDAHKTEVQQLNDQWAEWLQQQKDETEGLFHEVERYQNLCAHLEIEVAGQRAEVCRLHVAIAELEEFAVISVEAKQAMATEIRRFEQSAGEQQAAIEGLQGELMVLEDDRSRCSLQLQEARDELSAVHNQSTCTTQAHECRGTPQGLAHVEQQQIVSVVSERQVAGAQALARLQLEVAELEEFLLLALDGKQLLASQAHTLEQRIAAVNTCAEVHGPGHEAVIDQRRNRFPDRMDAGGQSGVAGTHFSAVEVPETVTVRQRVREFDDGVLSTVSSDVGVGHSQGPSEAGWRDQGDGGSSNTALQGQQQQSLDALHHKRQNARGDSSLQRQQYKDILQLLQQENVGMQHCHKRLMQQQDDSIKTLKQYLQKLDVLVSPDCQALEAVDRYQKLPLQPEAQLSDIDKLERPLTEVQTTVTVAVRALGAQIQHLEQTRTESDEQAQRLVENLQSQVICLEDEQAQRTRQMQETLADVAGVQAECHRMSRDLQECVAARDSLQKQLEDAGVDHKTRMQDLRDQRDGRVRQLHEEMAELQRSCTVASERHAVEVAQLQQKLQELNASQQSSSERTRMQEACDEIVASLRQDLDRANADLLQKCQDFGDELEQHRRLSRSFAEERAQAARLQIEVAEREDLVAILIEAKRVVTVLLRRDERGHEQSAREQQLLIERLQSTATVLKADGSRRREQLQDTLEELDMVRNRCRSSVQEAQRYATDLERQQMLSYDLERQVAVGHAVMARLQLEVAELEEFASVALHGKQQMASHVQGMASCIRDLALPHVHSPGTESSNGEQTCIEYVQATALRLQEVQAELALAQADRRSTSQDLQHCIAERQALQSLLESTEAEQKAHVEQLHRDWEEQRGRLQADHKAAQRGCREAVHELQSLRYRHDDEVRALKEHAYAQTRELLNLLPASGLLGDECAGFVDSLDQLDEGISGASERFARASDQVHKCLAQGCSADEALQQSATAPHAGPMDGGMEDRGQYYEDVSLEEWEVDVMGRRTEWAMLVARRTDVVERLMQSLRDQAEGWGASRDGAVQTNNSLKEDLHSTTRALHGLQSQLARAQEQVKDLEHKLATKDEKLQLKEEHLDRLEVNAARARARAEKLQKKVDNLEVDAMHQQKQQQRQVLQCQVAMQQAACAERVWSQTQSEQRLGLLCSAYDASVQTTWAASQELMVLCTAWRAQARKIDADAQAQLTAHWSTLTSRGMLHLQSLAASTLSHMHQKVRIIIADMTSAMTSFVSSCNFAVQTSSSELQTLHADVSEILQGLEPLQVRVRGLSLSSPADAYATELQELREALAYVRRTQSQMEGDLWKFTQRRALPDGGIRAAGPHAECSTSPSPGVSTGLGLIQGPAPTNRSNPAVIRPDPRSPAVHNYRTPPRPGASSSPRCPLTPDTTFPFESSHIWDLNPSPDAVPWPVGCTDPPVTHAPYPYSSRSAAAVTGPESQGVSGRNRSADHELSPRRADPCPSAHVCDTGRIVLQRHTFGSIPEPSPIRGVPAATTSPTLPSPTGRLRDS